MFLVQNEQTKHAAAWLNSLATALVAAGFFAPAAALVYGLSQVSVDRWLMTALALGCVGVGAGLHLLGRAVLKRLRE